MASLLSTVTVFLLLVFTFSLPISSSRKVELRTKDTRLDPFVQHEHSILSSGINPRRVIQLSWHPRIFLYRGFLSVDECDHLISLVEGKLKESPLIDTDLGNSITSNIRASSGRFLATGQDKIVSKIEERISTWTFLPKENGEGLQIQHYRRNESHEPHYDYYQDKSKLELGGNPIATVLMYLSNITQGGETVFPQSDLRDIQYKDDTLSDCVATGYSVKPIKGDALLFFNLHLDATPDESSLHGGCKVVEGEKWSAIKWIHVRPFNTTKPIPSVAVADGECTDEDDNCPKWAATGECRRNPVYMLGTPDYYGTCRKSCGAC